MSMSPEQIKHTQRYLPAIAADGSDLAHMTGTVPLYAGAMTQLAAIEYTARRLADRAAALRSELHQIAMRPLEDDQ